MQKLSPKGVLFVPLGWDCSASTILKKLELQRETFPLDNVMSTDFSKSLELISKYDPNYSGNLRLVDKTTTDAALNFVAEDRGLVCEKYKLILPKAYQKDFDEKTCRTIQLKHEYEVKRMQAKIQKASHVYFVRSSFRGFGKFPAENAVDIFNSLASIKDSMQSLCANVPHTILMLAYPEKVFEKVTHNDMDSSGICFLGGIKWVFTPVLDDPKEFRAPYLLFQYLENFPRLLRPSEIFKYFERLKNSDPKMLLSEDIEA